MMQSKPLSREEIEAAVAHARAQRAEAIRAGAVSLNLILKRFLSERRQVAPAPSPSKA